MVGYRNVEGIRGRKESQPDSREKKVKVVEKKDYINHTPQFSKREEHDTDTFGKSEIQIGSYLNWNILIHSANPQSRPVGIIVFAYVFRPSPLFKFSKTKQQKTMFSTGETVGLA